MAQRRDDASSTERVGNETRSQQVMRDELEGTAPVPAAGMMTKNQAAGRIGGTVIGAILGAILGFIVGLIFLEGTTIFVAVVAFTVAGSVAGFVAGGATRTGRSLQGHDVDR